MGMLTKWFNRRLATISIAVFLVIWFGLQLAVLNFYGQEAMLRLFYSVPTEQSLPAIQPGSFVSGLSHAVHDLSHLFENLFLLLVAGLLVEPRLGKLRVVFIVIVLGSMAAFLVNLSSPFHGMWMDAGASNGILALWSYSALRLLPLARQIARDTMFEPEHIEKTFAVLIVGAFPLVFVIGVLLDGNPGHLAGIVLGLLFYPFDRYLFLED